VPPLCMPVFRRVSTPRTRSLGSSAFVTGVRQASQFPSCSDDSFAPHRAVKDDIVGMLDAALTGRSLNERSQTRWPQKHLDLDFSLEKKLNLDSWTVRRRSLATRFPHLRLGEKPVAPEQVRGILPEDVTATTRSRSRSREKIVEERSGSTEASAAAGATDERSNLFSLSPTATTQPSTHLVSGTQATSLIGSQPAPNLFGSTQSSSSLFGGSQAVANLSGGTQATSLFGSQTAPNLFGSTPSSASLFGSQTAPNVFASTQSSSSLFGSQTAPNVFGSTQSSSSVFGSSHAATNLFGATQSSSSLSGASQSATALFGGIQSSSGLLGTSQPTTTLFGGTQSSSSTSGVCEPGANLFSGASAENNMFGSGVQNGSIFGKPSISSLLGSNNQTSSLFGSPPTSSGVSSNPSTSGLFGNQTTNSLFGSSQPVGPVGAAIAAAGSGGSVMESAADAADEESGGPSKRKRVISLFTSLGCEAEGKAKLERSASEHSSVAPAPAASAGGLFANFAAPSTVFGSTESGSIFGAASKPTSGGTELSSPTRVPLAFGAATGATASLSSGLFGSSSSGSGFGTPAVLGSTGLSMMLGTGSSIFGGMTGGSGGSVLFSGSLFGSSDSGSGAFGGTGIFASVSSAGSASSVFGGGLFGSVSAGGSSSGNGIFSTVRGDPPSKKPALRGSFGGPALPPSAPEEADQQDMVAAVPPTFAFVPKEESAKRSHQDDENIQEGGRRKADPEVLAQRKKLRARRTVQPVQTAQVVDSSPERVENANPFAGLAVAAADSTERAKKRLATSDLSAPARPPSWGGPPETQDSAAPSAPTQLTPVPSSPAGLFTATTTVSGTSQAAVPATQEAAPPASAEPTGTAHDDTEAPSKPIEVKTSEDFWMVQVQAVYRKRNPKKLDTVPKLMEKYKGNEKQLYVKVCKTYDLNPSKLYANADAWADEDKDVKDEEGEGADAVGSAGPPRGIGLGAATGGIFAGSGSAGSIFAGGAQPAKPVDFAGLFNTTPGTGQTGGLFQAPLMAAEAASGGLFGSIAAKTDGSSLFSSAFGASTSSASSGGAVKLDLAASLFGQATEGGVARSTASTSSIFAPATGSSGGFTFGGNTMPANSGSPSGSSIFGFGAPASSAGSSGSNLFVFGSSTTSASSTGSSIFGFGGSTSSTTPAGTGFFGFGASSASSFGSGLGVISFGAASTSAAGPALFAFGAQASSSGPALFGAAPAAVPSGEAFGGGGRKRRNESSEPASRSMRGR